MKTRESGMPEESLWSQFFDAERVLQALGLSPESGDVVDFGCGYGTFAVPAARMVKGTVHALDIDPAMVGATAEAAAGQGLSNVRVCERDFVALGSGLPDAVAGYVMLFNILHAEDPLVLLREARRNLRAGGTLAVMHWNYDPATPRGPSMEIRPRPEQLCDWAFQVGFEPFGEEPIDLPPFHYGMVFRKA